jgi:TatD DNase family protein
MARARAAGVDRMLVPGFDVASSRAAVTLAKRHPGVVSAAVGVHPHFAAEMDEPRWEEIGALAADDGVVAVGEIGLDYFRNLSPPAVQRAAFERQLALAARLGKPVLVHDRDAHRDIRAALLAWSRRAQARPAGVLHAFSGDAELALEMTAAGFLVSFALPLTFHPAAGPREAAAAMEDGTFLTETDAPWLAPGGREARNEPTTVLRVLAELARLRHSTREAVARSVAEAYARLIGC